MIWLMPESSRGVWHTRRLLLWGWRQRRMIQCCFTSIDFYSLWSEWETGCKVLAGIYLQEPLLTLTHPDLHARALLRVHEIWNQNQICKRAPWSEVTHPLKTLRPLSQWSWVQSRPGTGLRKAPRVHQCDTYMRIFSVKYSSSGF